MSTAMMQTTNVGLTGMMNDGRHHHHQPQIQQQHSGFKHCCCFGSNPSDYQYQDQHRGCHGNPNLGYYQNNYVQQNTTSWYNNNEYEHYNIYQDQWSNSSPPENNSSSTATAVTSATTSWTNTSSQTMQTSNPSKSPSYEQYYSSYPTPPTPAGSVVSTGSAGECPPSVAPSLQSIPSDHYPPTPYSVDLSSPTSASASGSSSDAAAAVMGYATNMGYSSPNANDDRSSAAIDIPLHELIGAAEAVEADLLESMQVCVQADNVEKAVAAASNKPKNMASSTCSTSSSINSSCWKESLEQQQAEQVAETAAAPAPPAISAAVTDVAVTSSPGSATFHAPKAAAVSGGIHNFVSHGAKRYDPEQLQRFLSDACSDWKDRPKRLKRKRSPSPPCLNAHYDHAGEENSRLEIGPPRLEMQAKKVKTIRLTKFADEKHVACSSRQKSSQITKNFTFACSSCSQSWPLHSDYIDNISQHLSQSGTAPLLKSNRLAFSQFFQYFSYKVRLLVNPKTCSVSTKTVLVCNDCSKTFNLLQDQEDLPLLLHQHLRHAHHDVKYQENYCYFCDRKVHNLTRHLDEYFSIHHSRLMALATCHHSTTIQAESESQCKKCGQVYVPDARLPDWMSRATCNQCLEWCLSKSSSKPSSVILCQYCRQGKFGLTTSCQSMSISICLNCSKMATAFQKMTDASQCRSYVTGMLNELLKQLGQETTSTPASVEENGEKLPEATFSLRQLLQTSVLDDKVQLAKFQSFTLHNMKTIEAVNASASTINPGSALIKEQTKISCCKCDQDWNHLVQQSGTLSKHLSKSLDQNLVIFSAGQSSKISLTSVLRCRKCKFYLPTHSEKQMENVIQHVQACHHQQSQVSGSSSSCAVCGGASKNGNSKHDCLQILKESLVLHCHHSTDWVVNNNNQNMAVNNLPRKNMVNIGKLAKCLNILSQAFENNQGCSIEELIVASKQKIKS